MMTGGGWFVSWIALVLFVLLIGGVVVAVVWFARQGYGGLSQANRQGPGEESDALEILRHRYARGEIGREEFERIRDDLRG